MKVSFGPVLLSIFCLSLLAPAQTESKLDYRVTLADAGHHRVHVLMTYDPETAGDEVQLPVWNGLYQVRDFAKNVLEVKATSQSGEQLPLKQVDKTTWEFRPRPGWVKVDYDIILDEAGPFGAQFNLHHAFFNLAELLMYPINGRDLPIALRFEEVPLGWGIATALPVLDVPVTQPPGAPGYMLHADNYDRLVDSPCELGRFSEIDFEQDRARYRVVIDADSRDYDSRKLVDALKKITASETAWMNDRPFDSYLFIYHFPKGPAGGGMEHAYSTAIDHSADDLNDLREVESVSAHEFFHLWNVKRIRPQSLEPIDYTRENYTRALWFSEGVTTTVADLALLKAGLLQPEEYFQRISGAITNLQSRPAHSTQSAEESSLDTWLDKYASYHAPERSISYYNKGDLLGIMLDLKIRQDSQGRYSLRDLFQEMNRDYAKQGKLFPDSEGVRQEAEKLAGTDLQKFFAQYIAGTTELPYGDLLSTVGLSVGRELRSIADSGFRAARNFAGPLIIEDVYGDQARAAGLQEGDEIVTIDGHQPTRNLEQLFANATSGTKIHLTVVSKGVRKDVELTLGERSVETYRLRESPTATQDQLARRRAWLNSEDQLVSGAK
jgi:predicted metalloprotease with PDZ domain